MSFLLERIPRREVIVPHSVDTKSPNVRVGPTELLFSGDRISYVEVGLDACTGEDLRDLTVQLNTLDDLAFSIDFGLAPTSVPEKASFELDKKDALLFLAIDRGDAVKQERVVGFLCGLPARTYALEEVHVTQDDGTVLTLPFPDTYYLHTVVVLPEDRGRKVGYNLWKLFQRDVFPPYGTWNSLAFFAAFRKSDHQAYLLRLLDRELDLSNPKESWRILSKGEIRSITDPQGQRHKRDIPVCYMLIYMKGKYKNEKALTLDPMRALVPTTRI